MHLPRTTHLDVIDRILRYLKGTPELGIYFKNNNSNKIYDYSDADWVEGFDRKSTIDFCTFIYENIVTWRSKKQSVVNRSSIEMEYRAMTLTESELIWNK
jgi:hypothetical protein